MTKIDAQTISIPVVLRITVPVDQVEMAQAVAAAAIEHSTARDAIIEAFAGGDDPIPMEIDAFYVPDQMIAVAVGNPVDGLEFSGPTVANSEEVERFTDEVLSSNEEWWYCNLATLPGMPTTMEVDDDEEDD